VESNVFSITVVVSTQQPPYKHYVARRVVWRRQGASGTEVVPVIPFERLPPSSLDLSRIEKDLKDADPFAGRF